MNVPTARARVLAAGGGRLGRPASIAVALTASATALVACAPGFVLEQSLRLVSAVHPDVAISVDGAAVGWLTSKPSLGRVMVTGKSTNTVLFQCDGIKASASLLDVLLGRCKGEVNVFVERPRVAAYDAVNAPVVLKGTAFSGQLDADEWIHVYVSDGELVVDQQAAQLLKGRLFVDLVKSGARVSFACTSPGLSLRGGMELAGRVVRFVKPVEATAEITQAFLSSVLGSVNPLLGKSVAVGGGSVALEIRPVNDVISLDTRRGPVAIEVDIGAYSTKIRQGEIIDDVLRILSLSSKNQRDLVIESGPARVLVSIDGGGVHRRQHVETVIEKVSLIFSDSRRVDVGLSTTLDGSPADFASGAAALDMAIDIHPSTLREVMKIRSPKKPLRVDVRGVMAKPRVMAKDALVRLGLLLVDGVLA